MEYRLAGLAPASRYVAQIRSLNDVDTSEWSPGFYITTPRDTTIPAALTSVTGFYSDGAFRFAWSPYALNLDGTPIADFFAYQITLSDGTNSFTDTVQDVNYVVDASTWLSRLGNGPTVSLSVYVEDKYGNKGSAISTSVTAPAPDNVTGLTSRGGNGYIVLNWTAVSNVTIEKYQVFVGDSPSFTPDTVGLTNLAGEGPENKFQWDATGAPVHKYFKVRAVSIFGGVSAGYASTDNSPVIVVPDTDAPAYTALLGAVGYWKLNETTGTTAIDYGSNVDPGLYYGGVTINQSNLLPHSGQSSLFNGSTGRVNISTSHYQTLNAQWTVAAIIKPSSTADGVILTPEWFTGQDIPFILAQGTLSGTVGTSGKFIAGWQKAGLWHTVESTTSVSAGTVYYVVATYDGADVKIYVDAIPEATTTTGAQTGSYSPTNHIFIGVDWNETGRHYNGYISDVQIYNRNLTPVEINNLYTRYNIGATGGSSGTISPLTTKGDIYTYDTQGARLPVGADGKVLTANSSAPQGISWETATGGGSAIVVKDEGTTLTTGVTSIDFVGGGVTATHSGSLVTVTIPQDATYTFGPNSTSLTTAYSTLTYVTGLGTGSYILELDADGVIYTGYMSWRAGTVTANAYNEIILNRSSLIAPSYLLSARIYGDPSDGLQKLQLQANSSITVTNLYVKIRQLI